jgi:hypothetical protein|uniref:Uncharacterized protein n=1 Tax=viral metagenome TaxID=1070528 RepID=A0A6C0IL02_9ZZZZ
MDDIIEISSLDGIDYGSKSSMSSGKFGDGIELLMNGNKEASKKDPDGLGLDELDQLETDLNDIAGSSASKNDIFSDTIRLDDSKPSVSFEEPNLSSDTRNPTTSTWDGFEKFNDIPVNPEVHAPPKPAQSKEEMLREKFQLLRKLEMLEQKGVQLSKKYSMDSPILEMKGEYETIMDEKAKQNSIKFQGNIMMTCINGIEFLNNRFDPFDLKLEGWSEQIADNMDDYDEVFSELYDKYKSKASMAPELKLLFQVGGSAAMLHMTNTMFKSAMPGMDDIMRQNPDLAKQFQQAAVNSMGNSNPGFSNFMNGVNNPDPAPAPGSGPPPPMSTQGPRAPPPPSHRSGNNDSFSSRPDLSRSVNMGDGINISENFTSAKAPERSMRSEQPPAQPRAEMKGPSDIDSILSNLKTKKVSMSSGPSAPSASSPPPVIDPPSSPPNFPELVNDSSTISISDLKDMQSSANAPKKSRRRRNGSDKNTISLDI